MLIAEGEAGKRRHYMATKSLSRLLASSNNKHKRKQHFLYELFARFPIQKNRDEHFEYCKDNETARIEMPEEGSQTVK